MGKENWVLNEVRRKNREQELMFRFPSRA